MSPKPTRIPPDDLLVKALARAAEDAKARLESDEKAKRKRKRKKR